MKITLQETELFGKPGKWVSLGKFWRAKKEESNIAYVSLRSSITFLKEFAAGEGGAPGEYYKFVEYTFDNVNNELKNLDKKREYLLKIKEDLRPTLANPPAPVRGYTGWSQPAFIVQKHNYPVVAPMAFFHDEPNNPHWGVVDPRGDDFPGTWGVSWESYPIYACFAIVE